MMEFLRTAFGHLMDIVKIYLKFAAITLVIYFVAEWYILRYGELADGNAVATAGGGGADDDDYLDKRSSNSTVDKLYRFVLNFLIL